MSIHAFSVSFSCHNRLVRLHFRSCQTNSLKLYNHVDLMAFCVHESMECILIVAYKCVPY